MSGRAKTPTPDSGLDDTIAAAASGIDDTIAADSSGIEDTIAADASGGDDTVAAERSPDSGLEDTLAAVAGTGLSEAERAERLADAATLPEVSRDHYHIIEEYDRGGLGRILRARDKRTGRVVAIKEMLAGSYAGARFRREALLTANLQHPAIVPVYEVGRWRGGEPFYAMKLVSGRPLSKCISEGSTMAERLALLPHVITVADALAYAHSEGVIHRDLKPANVLVGSFGETVVIDWGLAKALGTEDIVDPDPDPDDQGNHLTKLGAVMGTPAYMPPQQALGEAVDERADVYAIGAILYHVLTGLMPYRHARSGLDIIDQVVKGPPEAIRSLSPDAPEELVAIAEKAMAHDLDARYPTAKELADELRRYETGKLVSAHAYTTWELVRRWLRRHKAAVSVATIALVMCAVLIAVSVQRIVSARDRATRQQAIAEEATTTAVKRLAALYQEQGRQALGSGENQTAAAYLSKAYSLGRDTPALRMLLSEVSRVMEARKRGLRLVGHKGPVAEIRFTPDGSKLVTAGADPAARVWDANSGALIARLRGHPDGVNGIAISTDGARVITVGADKRVRVWSTATWTKTAETPVVGPALSRRVALHPKGTHIATASLGAGAALWDAATGKKLRDLVHPTAMSVAFSADGTHLFTGDTRGGGVQVWDTATGQKRGRLAVPGFVITMAPTSATELLVQTDQELSAWSFRDGKKLAAMAAHDNTFTGAHINVERRLAVVWTSRGEVRGWLIDQRQSGQTYRGHRAAVSRALINRFGEMVSASEDGTVAVWDRLSATHVIRFGGRNGDHGAIAVSPTENRIAMTDAPNEVLVVGAFVGRRFRPMNSLQRKPSDVRFSPDGKRAVIGGQMPKAIVIDLEVGKTVRSIGEEGAAVVRATYARNANRIATRDNHGVLAVWDPSTGRRLTRIPATGASMDFAPDGTSLAGVKKRGELTLWNAETAAVRWTRPIFDINPWIVGFSTDGTRVLAGTDNGKAAAVETSTGKVMRLPSHEQRVRGLRYSAKSDTYATLGNDGKIIVSDASSGKTRFQISGNASAMDLSPDGASVLVGFATGRVEVWSARTGERTQAWQGHKSPVLILAYAPDGVRAVSSAFRESPQIWDTTSGTSLAHLDGHGLSMIVRVRFSPDGNQLLSMGDGEIRPRLWDTRLETRTPAQIEALVRCASRWVVKDGRLAAHEPSACSE